MLSISSFWTRLKNRFESFCKLNIAMPTAWKDELNNSAIISFVPTFNKTRPHRLAIITRISRFLKQDQGEAIFAQGDYQESPAEKRKVSLEIACATLAGLPIFLYNLFEAGLLHLFQWLYRIGNFEHRQPDQPNWKPWVSAFGGLIMLGGSIMLGLGQWTNLVPMSSLPLLATGITAIIMGYAIAAIFNPEMTAKLSLAFIIPLQFATFCVGKINDIIFNPPVLGTLLLTAGVALLFTNPATSLSTASFLIGLSWVMIGIGLALSVAAFILNRQAERPVAAVSRSDARMRQHSKKSSFTSSIIWSGLGAMIACGAVLRLGGFNLHDFHGVTYNWLHMYSGIVPNLVLGAGIIGAGIMFYFFDSKLPPKTHDAYDVFSDLEQIASYQVEQNDQLTVDALNSWIVRNGNPLALTNLARSMYYSIHLLETPLQTQLVSQKLKSAVPSLFTADQNRGQPIHLDDAQKNHFVEVLNMFQQEVTLQQPKTYSAAKLGSCAVSATLITSTIYEALAVSPNPVLILSLASAAVISSIFFASTLSYQNTAERRLKKGLAVTGMAVSLGLVTTSMLTLLNFKNWTNQLFKRLFFDNPKYASLKGLRFLNNSIAGGLIAFILVGVTAFGLLARWLASPDLRSSYKNFAEFKEQKIGSAATRHRTGVRVLVAALTSAAAIPLVMALHGASLFFGLLPTAYIGFFLLSSVYTNCTKPKPLPHVQQHLPHLPGAPGAGAGARVAAGLERRLEEEEEHQAADEGAPLLVGGNGGQR